MRREDADRDPRVDTFESLALLLDPLEPSSVPLSGQLHGRPSGAAGGVDGVSSGLDGVVVDGGSVGDAGGGSVGVVACAQATAAPPVKSAPESAPATRKCLRDIGWFISIVRGGRVGLEPRLQTSEQPQNGPGASQESRPTVKGRRLC